jgi:hypothetical protein
LCFIFNYEISADHSLILLNESLDDYNAIT